MNRDMNNSSRLKILFAEKLGSGRFGSVFPGRLKNFTEEVVIKRMERENIRIDSSVYRKAKGQPNVIGYYGTNSTDDVQFK